MRGQVAFGSDGRGSGALRDQRDLAEVVARPEPALLLTVHRDLGVSVLDHEEADAALALAGDLLACGELPALHRLRDLLELLVVQVREERDVLEQLGGVLVGHRPDSKQVLPYVRLRPCALAPRSCPGPNRACRSRGGRAPLPAPRA